MQGPSDPNTRERGFVFFVSFYSSGHTDRHASTSYDFSSTKRQTDAFASLILDNFLQLLHFVSLVLVLIVRLKTNAKHILVAKSICEL